MVNIGIVISKWNWTIEINRALYNGYRQIDIQQVQEEKKITESKTDAASKISGNFWLKKDASDK